MVNALEIGMQYSTHLINFAAPLALKGQLTIDLPGTPSFSVRIKQIQLEQVSLYTLSLK